MDNILPVFHELLALDPRRRLLQTRNHPELAIKQIRLRIKNQRLLGLVRSFVGELINDAAVDSGRYNLRFVVDCVYEVDQPRPQRKVPGVMHALVEDVHLEIGGNYQINVILFPISQAIDAIAAGRIEELCGEQRLGFDFHVRVLLRGPHPDLLFRVRHEALDRRIVLAIVNLQAVYMLVEYMHVFETEFYF